MKPYSGYQEKGSKYRVFKYRLNRPRRVEQHIFGMLPSVFRVFRKQMLLEPQKAEKVTLECVYLHIMYGAVRGIHENHLYREMITDEFAEYFISEHAHVPWQFRYC